MNTEPCINCSNHEWTSVARLPDLEYHSVPGEFTLLTCTQCKLIRVFPQTPLADIPQIYPSTYYTLNPESPLFLQGMIYETKIKRDVSRILKFLDQTQPQTVVDLGCGDPKRMVALAAVPGTKIKCMGVDIAFTSEMTQTANKHGVTLIEANLESENLSIADHSVDLFIMSQLIEHLGKPDLALKNLLTKLKPGGKILIETPNPGGLDHRLFRKKFWGGYHVPRHFYIFNQDNLSQFVTKAGYQIAEQGFLPSPGFWIISLRNWLGLNSVRKGKSLAEYLNFSNLIVVGIFTVFDILRSKLGFQTSNQFLIATRPSLIKNP